jgi:molecular chaperone GrpE
MNETERAANASQGDGSTRADATSPESNPTQDVGNLETLRKDLDEARSKANTYLDLAQRTQADFVNYKRRVEQERGEYSRSARADIITRILPILDDLERAIGSQPADIAGSVWAQGVNHIARKFESVLEGLGVKAIDAVGKPFDPWLEEAIAHEPSSTAPPETVTRVARGGFTLDGKVIRPAQVVVSSGPAQTNQEQYS